VKPLFTFGHVVANPGALAAIEKAGQQPGDLLAHHVSDVWGEISRSRHTGKAAHEYSENGESICQQLRLSYFPKRP